MFHKKHLFLAALMLLGILLVACQPETVIEQVEVTRVVTETVVQEGEEVEVTRIVTEIEEVEVPVQVTAVPDEIVMEGSDKVLRINLGTYPDIIDPQKSSFSNEISHLKIMYEGLTRLDDDLNTIPAAAEFWEYSDDATELTFTLREGLTYSDGSVLNAMRFKYALERTINPNTAGEYAAITDEIMGAPEWRAAEEADLAVAQELVSSSIQALDMDGNACTDYEQADCRTLKLMLSKPAPYFHTVMSLWVAYPAKEELIAEGGDNWWNSSVYHVGNGPYVLDSLEPFVRGNFTPNPNYWGGEGNMDIEYSYITDSAVAYQAYLNDEFDIVILAPEDLATVQNDDVLSEEALVYPGSCTIAFMFHLEKEPFTDQKVREAFAMAVDRDSFIRDVRNGLGSSTLTWIPEGFPGYQEGETHLGFDPEAARQAIADSSYGSIENLPPVTLTFGDSPRAHVRNEWLAAKWKEYLGVDVELNPVEPTTYTALTKDRETAPQMFRLGWCADYPDPQNWLSVYWKTGAFGERVGYSNADFDALVDEADTTVDPAVRSDLYQQAQDVLVGSSPGAFMYNNTNNYMVKPWVTGLETTPQDSDWPGSNNPLSIDIER